MTVAGPAWVWVLPIALVGQCLLLVVYAELASEFPVAGWRLSMDAPARRPWLRLDERLGRDLRLLRRQHDDRVSRCSLGPDPRRASTPTANAIVMMGMILVLVCAAIGRSGRRSARPRDPGGNRRRDPGLGRHRAGVAPRLSHSGHLDLHAHARGRGALGWLDASRDARSARCCRLGVHRLRRLYQRLGGDEELPATSPGRSGSRCSAWRRS